MGRRRSPVTTLIYSRVLCGCLQEEDPALIYTTKQKSNEWIQELRLGQLPSMVFRTQWECYGPSLVAEKTILVGGGRQMSYYSTLLPHCVFYLRYLFVLVVAAGLGGQRHHTADAGTGAGTWAHPEAC